MAINTIEAFYLGIFSDLDLDESDFQSEGSSSLLGLTFGGPDAPLYDSIDSLGMDDANDDGSVKENDNGQTGEDLIYDGVRSTLDSVIDYNVTITYSDGTTVTTQMGVVQDEMGRLFLRPYGTGNGFNDVLDDKPIESITLDSIVGDSFSGNVAFAEQDAFIDGDVDGTSGDDAMGTSYIDADGTQMNAYGGDDTVDGGAGNDTIQTGAGQDQVQGGSGADTIDAGEGDDTVDGGTGDDTIEGGEGADAIAGGDGADVIIDSSATSQDTIDGGAGADSISVGGGDDLVYGGTGSDTIAGGDGADVIYGGEDPATSVGGSNTVVTTYSVIHLGRAPEVDNAEGDAANDNENGLLGTYGGPGAELYNAIQTATTTDSNASGHIDPDDDATPETITVDGIDKIIDTGVVYNATVTFTDGTSGTFTAVVIQTTDGETYMMPEVSNNDDNVLLTSKPIESISLDSVAVNYTDIIPQRLDADYALPGDTDTSGDSIDGGAGADTIFGGAGSDTIDGGTGDDSLAGGDDADTFVVQDGFGTDTILGGEGGIDSDTIDLSRVTAPVTVTYTGDEAGTITDGANTITFSGVENLILTDLADLVDGTADGSGLNVVAGGGDDTVTGGFGNDTVDGGDGADDIQGGDGGDLLYGSAGFDTIDGGTGNDTIFGGSDMATITGGDGDDQIFAASSGSSIDGGTGADTIQGSVVDDTIIGGSGDDSIIANGGDDLIDAGSGDDLVDGGAGNDTIDGGSLPDRQALEWSEEGSGTDIGSGFTQNTGDMDITVTFQKFTSDPNSDAVIRTNEQYVETDEGIDAFSALLIEGGDQLGTTTRTTLDFAAAQAGVSDEVENVVFRLNDVDNSSFYTDSVTILAYDADGNAVPVTLSQPGATDPDNISGNTVTASGGGDSSSSVNGSVLVEIPGPVSKIVILHGNSGSTVTSHSLYVSDVHFDPISTVPETDNDTLTGGDGDDVFIVGDGHDTITDFNTGNSGALGDSDTTNNDFIDLSGHYDSMSELYADQADDGILNQSNTTDTKGNTVDYSDNTQFGPDSSLTIQGATADKSTFTTDNTGVACFTSGTSIRTPEGEVLIDNLRKGDLAYTLDNGPQPIRWIGSRHVSAAELDAHPNLRPIRIRAGALGPNIPEQDLIVSPQHRILVRSRIAVRMFDAQEVLVAAKHLLEVDGVDVASDLADITYYHFLFDQHEIVVAHGAEAESLYTGRQALKSVSPEARKEIFLLFPELESADCPPPTARHIVARKRASTFAQRHLKNGHPLVTAIHW
ncbi:Ca2+-binding protein, RTX toxin-related [Aliiroseovarius crassostreae]|uniref:Hedgehog/Intein (Hint) domain-containing protein n=1 Tax=Aliiroseovarius crassostreae TaxID=154981 RepID=A0A0P7I3G6_9RHOB|nr:Hint domain-containing protein [Aliiroseovarius crassostreae]KPN63705.1 hypothetical protein AKJ29_13890 [Aliiroseovarius crassostreae]SFU88259.1 Ca2+-binding protein, RTX toxin-related [Aliiroseovarius crassostreae]